MRRKTAFTEIRPLKISPPRKCEERPRHRIPRCTTPSSPPGIPATLHLGSSLSVSPPVILSPMAGVTNYPFRKLCRSYGAGLYVSEMVHAASVATGRPDARARFGEDESPRSAQLYATDSGAAAAAAEVLIARDGVRHVDLNFGCPAPKVLRKGGGAAIPRDEGLLKAIAGAVVEVARAWDVPVTAKMRAGVNEQELTFCRAGLAVQEVGVSAVILHGRTAEERYQIGAGRRGWRYVRELTELLDIPVVGNGDVFTAADALEMVKETGAAGVAVGRGCLGRPWVFRDLCEAFQSGREAVCVPGFEEVRAVMVRHVEEGVEWMARDEVTEEAAVRAMRKWFGWYWRGYTGLPDGWVQHLCRVSSLGELREVVAGADGDGVRYVLDEVVGARGKVDARHGKGS